MPHAWRLRDAILPAGILLGIGLTGLADGIVLHQILGWHHLVDGLTSDPGARLLWDGVFHAIMWVALVAGLALLVREGRNGRAPLAPRRLLGSVLLGAGGFNLVEGLVDHQILELHHVHPSSAPGWDLAFLAVALLVTFAGWLELRRASGPSHRVPSGPRARRHAEP